MPPLARDTKTACPCPGYFCGMAKFTAGNKIASKAKPPEPAPLTEEQTAIVEAIEQAAAPAEPAPQPKNAPMSMVKPAVLDVIVSEKRLHGGGAGTKVIRVIRCGATAKLTTTTTYE